MEPTLKPPNGGLLFPETIVISRKAMVFCWWSLGHELFYPDAFDEASDGEAKQPVEFLNPDGYADCTHLLKKLDRVSYWSWREYVARYVRRSLREGLRWHLRIRRLGLVNAAPWIRVSTDWLSTMFSSVPLEQVQNPAPSLLSLPRSLVLSKNYFRWCESGGHPALGRYLARHYERQLPTH